MHFLKLLNSSSTMIFKLRKIALFQYSQTHHKPKKTHQQRFLDEEVRHDQNIIVDKSYWQNILPKIEAPAAKVIKLLIKPESSRKEISRELQNYLEFRNFTFTENIRTDLGCASVLTALNISKNSENNEEYETRIIDFITLSDIKYSAYDSIMLKYLMLGIKKRISTNIQKNLKQYYRMKMIEIIHENFERLDNKDLGLLATIIQESIDKDKMNFITKWRFYPLIQSLSSRIIQLMETSLNTKQYEIKRAIDIIISPNFYLTFLRLIFHYGYMPAEHVSIIYRFETSRKNQFYSDQQLAINFFNLICYIPFTEITETDGKKTTFRKKMLQFLQSKYNESRIYRKSWYEFPMQTKRFTFQKVLQEQFHAVFRSLPFSKVENKYLLLKKQHLVLPQIPEFLWVLFKQNEKMYLEKIIFNSCIKTLYPNRISLPKEETPDFSQRNLHAFSDNEVNMKIWQVLTKLGYQFKKQQICADRQVDLLIEGNIILEADGEGHYMFLTNELSPETTYRNLHLLLSGYKLVIVSMFEYNIHRSPEALEKLIKEKLEYVKNQDYIYVC